MTEENMILDESLSARRAWIEMLNGTIPQECKNAVALRKESVDRNFFVVGPSPLGCGVALRKESVDRNIILLVHKFLLMRRSPQGERG